MDIFNGFLSVIMHVLIAVFLLIYLSVSWIWRLIVFIFVKPFYKEDVGGKVVLIMGASSGIGEELAYQYATKGASLVLVARREQAVKEVAMAALGKGSPDVLVIKADISKQSECKRVIEEAIAHFTKLNHLVVNAGLLSSSLFEDITNISAFNQIMASKAALIRFYETLRAELGSDIRITILGPGFIASELTKGKFLQKGGEIALTEEIRDVQFGLFPVGYTHKSAENVVEGACDLAILVQTPSCAHVLSCS